MNSPLVSIIVTCYNRADMVTKALDSVFAQNYRPLELVIVDDGSKDNSWEVIRQWKGNHPGGDGFSCIAQTFPNGKLCIARNRGLELCHGELVQYVDDDDWLYPECVSKKVTAFQQDPTRDVVVHQVELINKYGRTFGTSHLSLETDDSKQLLHLLDVHTETLFSPTLMFRKDKLLAVGAWTPGLIFADDIDVVFRMAAAGARFGIVDEALSAYNMHDAVRQCNKVIYELPDDFWSSLFQRMWTFFQTHGRTSSDVRKGLASQAELYATRQLHGGRFNAAWMGFSEAATISGGKPKGFLTCPWGIRHCLVYLDYIFHSTWRRARILMKIILRKN